MDKKILIDGLKRFQGRLLAEVLQAYGKRGASYGHERFGSWFKKFEEFLATNLPAEVDILNAKLSRFGMTVFTGESPARSFWNADGDKLNSYIDSLILDIQNDEYNFEQGAKDTNLVNTTPKQKGKPKDKVFIVHGHDELTKEKTARFIEKLGLKAIILHELPSRSKTIIEKIEENLDGVGFGIVLYTPDDKGNEKDEAEQGNLNFRARQNVILEHGILMGKLGRENVAVVVNGFLELPNDISGLVYINETSWKEDLIKELVAAGYDLELKRIFC
ncbi:TIR domain-containing protein [Microbulbifer sp. JMSA002]|uniref:TIR domain-containing protein n=1 Tax=Microbulbifer sp. JMSA002 TaxID=3243368 RepID=UPI00403A4CA3